MDLNAVLLAEIGKKLVKPGAVSGVVAVSSKPFTAGLYTNAEEPPVPPGHKRIHYNNRYIDLPAEGVKEWLNKNAPDALLIMLS